MMMGADQYGGKFMTIWGVNVIDNKIADHGYMTGWSLGFPYYSLIKRG
jgi:hypothetical protein